MSEESDSSDRLSWFLVALCKCPTSENDSFIAAIEASSMEHARRRLYDLYDDNYASPNGGAKDQTLRPLVREDQMRRAVKFPVEDVLAEEKVAMRGKKKKEDRYKIRYDLAPWRDLVQEAESDYELPRAGTISRLLSKMRDAVYSSLGESVRKVEASYEPDTPCFLITGRVDLFSWDLMNELSPDGRLKADISVFHESDPLLCVEAFIHRVNGWAAWSKLVHGHMKALELKWDEY